MGFLIYIYIGKKDPFFFLGEQGLSIGFHRFSCCQATAPANFFHLGNFLVAAQVLQRESTKVFKECQDIHNELKLGFAM